MIPTDSIASKLISKHRKRHMRHPPCGKFLQFVLLQAYCPVND
jgi:hypothetical protein